MKHLLIMRHGKSDWSSDTGGDFTRPLSKRGVKTAGKIGNWIRLHGPRPEFILSSPATRAKVTACLVSEALQRSESDIVYDKRIYDASLDDLLDVIADHAKHKSVLLVGHNPGLDALLDYLSNQKPERNRNGKLMTTAAVAILNYREQGDVKKQGCARLKKLVRPGEL